MGKLVPTTWGAVVLILGTLVGTPLDAAPAFTGLVVFGDSLSDNGNAGRFSNGPVWVEHLAARIGLDLQPARNGGTNHAVGGARARGGPTDVGAQVAAFLAARGGAVDRNALYVVYGGGNDLLAAALAPDRDAVAREAATALGSAVDDLAAAGAGRILVPNLPDIGIAPLVRAQGAAWASEARRLTRAFNTTLQRALARVEAARSATILRLDVFALAERVMADPAAAGFRDVTNPCLGTSCEGALFWDPVHPTTRAHARLAAAALPVLATAPSAAARP
jgi:phospholipase/lecithinase/hemolysin